MGRDAATVKGHRDPAAADGELQRRPVPCKLDEEVERRADLIGLDGVVGTVASGDLVPLLSLLSA